MKVLIIKLTSMGDLMHALPALTDAVKVNKEISFDWVVDENFSSVPKWHPNVDQVITTNHRTWKKQIFNQNSREAFKRSLKKINNSHYDVVVDMQNNIKSSFISALCNFDVHGMDASSVRELPAHWSYKHLYKIPKQLHAISRQRLLLSNCLNYKINEKIIDYGITKTNFDKPKVNLPNRYVVLVHNASKANKLWPIKYWQEIINNLHTLGFSCVLPSGNKSEFHRAQKISTCSPHAYALEPMPLNNIAFIMDSSQGSICSDTGLAHLAALVGIPSITMYSVTDHKLIGTSGKNQKHIVSKNKKMESIFPQEIFNEFTSMKRI